MNQPQLQLDPATIRQLRSAINRAIECRGAIEGGYTFFRRISCGLVNDSEPTIDTLTNEDIACLDFVMDHNLAMLADYLSAIDQILNPIAAPEDSNEPVQLRYGHKKGMPTVSKTLVISPMPQLNAATFPAGP